MAEYYGQIRGRGKNRATQCGDRRSGISASVQSWRGSLTLELYGGHEAAGISPTFELRLRTDSQMGGPVILSGKLSALVNAEGDGPIADALELLQRALTEASRTDAPEPAAAPELQAAS